jgi:hypothetical protein
MNNFELDMVMRKYSVFCMNLFSIAYIQNKLIFTLILFFVGLPIDVFSQDIGDNLAEVDDRVKIAKKIAELADNDNIAHEYRKVDFDEITTCRGYEEDSLRMFLLADYDKQHIGPKLRELLNSDWSHDTVTGLWALDPYEGRSHTQSGRTLPLLLYASKKYKNEVFLDVQDILDNICHNLTESAGKGERVNGLFLREMESALSQYGYPEILKDSFWEALENENIGRLLIKSIGDFGDSNTLEKLKIFKRECNWTDKASLEIIRYTEDKLEKKIYASNKENKDVKMNNQPRSQDEMPQELEKVIDGQSKSTDLEPSIIEPNANHEVLKEIKPKKGDMNQEKTQNLRSKTSMSTFSVFLIALIIIGIISLTTIIIIKLRIKH